MPKIIFIIGVVLIVLSGILYFAPWLISWFGKLPGDINVVRDNFRFFMPITSMLIMTVIINLLVKIVKKFF